MISMPVSIYIFGAHTRAQNLYAYLSALFPECKVEGFLYDNEEPNPSSLHGIAVTHIDEIEELSEQAEIWVATKSVYFENIVQKINHRFSNRIVPVTAVIDNELRDRYAEQIFREKGIAYTKIYDLTDGSLSDHSGKQPSKMPAIYMARSIYDKHTLEHVSSLSVIPIQAGAALTDQRIAAVSDHTGDNISSKNRQYSELTVLYWMWKNVDSPWVGLCHYRRHFVLSDEAAAYIPQTDVDVVLPVPSICQPSVGENYRKRHDERDWNHLLYLLESMYPEYFDTAMQIWETPEYGNLYYTCNMFIMKKEVLNAYCSWLFPILEEMERFAGEKDDQYQNRYPGFLAERLMTLFFLHHREQYRITHIDKIFIPNK